MAADLAELGVVVTADEAEVAIERLGNKAEKTAEQFDGLDSTQKSLNQTTAQSTAAAARDADARRIQADAARDVGQRYAQVNQIHQQNASHSQHAAQVATAAAQGEAKAISGVYAQLIAMTEKAENEYRANIAAIKDSQARGFISPAEAERAGREAALAYNRGMTAAIDHGHASGAINYTPAGGFADPRSREAYIQLAGSLKNVDEAGKKTIITAARLREGFTSLMGTVLHTAPGVATLSGLLGTWAIGAGPMIAILAGIAAIGIAWKLSTKEIKAAKEEAEKNIKVLEQLQQQKRDAMGGDIMRGIVEAEMRAKRLEAKINDTDSSIAVFRREKWRRDLAELKNIIATGYEAHGKVIKDKTDDNQKTWDAARKKAAREQKQANDEFLKREREFINALLDNRELIRDASFMQTYVDATRRLFDLYGRIVDKLKDVNVELRERIKLERESLRVVDEIVRTPHVEVGGRNIPGEKLPNGETAPGEIRGGFMGLGPGGSFKMPYILTPVVVQPTTTDFKPAVKKTEEIWAEAMRGIQNEFADGFERIFSDGVSGFVGFADQIVDVFRGVAAQIAAGFVANKLGLDQLIKDLEAGQGPKWLKYGGGAVIGGMAGYQSGNVGVGVLSGAASGAALGGPVGAVLGAVGGLAGGLLGHAKKAEEARRLMDAAVTEFNTRMRDVIITLGGTDAEKEFAQWRSQVQGFVDEWMKTFDMKGKIDLSKSTDTAGVLAQLEKQRAALAQANQLFNGLGINPFTRQIESLDLVIQAATATVAAARREEEERQRVLEQDRQKARQGNDVLRLRAQGMDAEAAALALANERQRELADIKDEQLRALAVERHALEDLIAAREREADAAREAIRTWEEINRAALEADRNLSRTVLQNSLDSDTNAIKAALDGILAGINAQTAAIEQQLAVAQEQLRAQEQAVGETRRVLDSLTKYSAGLSTGSMSPLSPSQRLAEARRQFEEQSALARGGDKNAAAGLTGFANTLLEASRAFNASGAHYVEDFNAVKRTIDELTKQYGNQLSVEEQMLAALQAQTAQLQAQLEALQAAGAKAESDAQRQIDALNEIFRITVAMHESTGETDLLLAKLEELRKTADEVGRATIDAQSASLLDTRNALQQASIAEIQAIRDGAPAHEIAMLEQVRRLEELKNDYNTRAVAQIAELAAIHGWGSAQVTELERQRVEYLAKHQEAIDAVRAGPNGITRVTDDLVNQKAQMQIDELMRQREALNTGFEASVSKLRDMGLIDADTYAVMVAARDAADRNALDQIAAIAKGPVDVMRVNDELINAKAQIQIDELMRQRDALNAGFEASVTKLRDMGLIGADTYAVLSQAKDAANQNMAAQIAKLEEVRAAGDAIERRVGGTAIDQLAELREQKRALLEKHQLGIDTALLQLSRIDDVRLANEGVGRTLAGTSQDQLAELRAHKDALVAQQQYATTVLMSADGLLGVRRSLSSVEIALIDTQIEPNNLLKQLISKSSENVEAVLKSNEELTKANTEMKAMVVLQQETITRLVERLDGVVENTGESLKKLRDLVDLAS